MGHAPIPPQRPSLRPADLATEAPASPVEPQRDWQPVTLLDNVRWQALVRALLEKCAPDSPATGTLVTVQGGDVVLYRDAAGKLHSVRFEDKPAALRIGPRISEEAFSARANDHLKAELSREGRALGPVLFAVGEDELGGAFVLFDFARRQSVFIAQAPGPNLHVSRRIEGIALDRVAQFSQVDAQLMRAAGNRLEFDTSVRTGFIVPQYAPTSEGRLAAKVVDNPEGPVGSVDDDGQIDHSPVLRRRFRPATTAT